MRRANVISRQFWLSSSPRILLAALLLCGCGKKGCKDVLATNYDATAKVDDGSCRYSANVMIWLSRSTVDSTDAVFPLEVRVGGKIVGHLWSYHNLLAEPDNCIDDSTWVFHNYRPTNYDFTTVIEVVDSLKRSVWGPQNTALQIGKCTKIKV